MKQFLLASELYEYPTAYKKIIELNLVDFDIWYLIEEGQATRRFYDLKKRYPNRRLVPFARRDDADDIACFEIGKGEEVQMIHDFTTEGYEQRGIFVDIWDWIEFAVKEMISYNREAADDA